MNEELRKAREVVNELKAKLRKTEEKFEKIKSTMDKQKNDLKMAELLLENMEMKEQLDKLTR